MSNIKAQKQIVGGQEFVQASEGGIVGSISAQILWTAKGYGFQAMATAAVAALVVRPGTTAMATLRNNSSNKNLIIQRVFAHNLVTAVEENAGLWLVVHPTGMAAVTNDITVRNSTNGGAAGGSETSFDNGATVSDDGWFPWGASEWTNLDGTVPGGQLEAMVNGTIIVPPTGGISIHVVSSTTVNTYTAGFHYFEVPVTELNTA